MNLKQILVSVVLVVLGCATQERHHQLWSEKSYGTKSYLRRHSKGLNKTEASKFHMRAQPHLSYLGMPGPVPKSMDLSPLVSPPEDQKNCGCCWDFALTKSLRSEYMLHGEDPGTLDFNYLLSNCGPGPKMDGCDGGDFSAATSFLSGSGPGLNKYDPFIGAERHSCKKLTAVATAKTFTMLGEADAGPSFKDIAFAVGVSKHVLSVDVAAGQGEWENYDSGIYNSCVGTSADVDHMLNLVGYDCETSVDEVGNCVFDSEGKPIHGDGYLLLMNQWGEDWGTDAAAGHKGYMKTRMYGADGRKCNAVATDAGFFQISPPLPNRATESCTGFLCNKDCNLPWCRR